MMIVIFILVFIFFVTLVIGVLELVLSLFSPKYSLIPYVTCAKKRIALPANFDFKNIKSDYRIKKEIGEFLFLKKNQIIFYKQPFKMTFYYAKSQLRCIGSFDSSGNLNIKVKLPLAQLIISLLIFVVLIIAFFWTIIHQGFTQVLLVEVSILTVIVITSAMKYFSESEILNKLLSELNEILTSMKTDEHIP